MIYTANKNIEKYDIGTLYAGYLTVGENAEITNRREDIMGGRKVITFDVEIITLPGPTRNGMLYPLEEMKKAVNSERIQDMLKRGSFYGEGEHPLNPEDFQRWVYNDVSNRRFKWTKIWFEGNVMKGTVQTFSGNGNLLYEAIVCGELPAFSIRVIGAPTKKGKYTELHDITIISIDWVGYPGNPTSYVHNSDEFKFVEPPIVEGFSRDTRIVTRSESFDELGIKENESLIALGKGFYKKVERLDKDQLNKLKTIRHNAF